MKKHTVCRLCSSCCPVDCEIKDGQLIGAERRSFLPIEKRLVCPKLKAAPEIVYSPERLKRPLIKRSDGGFREASWNEALEQIVEQFHYFKEIHGAQSIGWLRGMAADWGAPWDYVNRLMNAFGSPNTIGNGSVCHVGREFAHAYTYGAMTIPDVNQSECIVVWGKNDMDTNPMAMESILNAKRNGAKLIVVDPVKIGLASIADIWLQVRPAYDGPLAMAMIHTIITQRLFDEDFVGTWGLGFDQLKEAAENFAPEKVAPYVWLEADQIKDAARLYATTKPACIVDGNGLDMQLNVFQATRAVAMLRALTGNLDKSGGDLIPQPVPARNLQLKERLPEEIQPITSDYPLFNSFNPTWGNHVQSCLVDAILDETPYPINMLVVQSGNPAVTLTDSNRVRRALEKVDFLVVIDLFMTQTGQLADVILPASSCFEKTQLNRAYLRNNLVRIQDAVIEPLYESWPDWEITFELGRRLGLQEEFPWRTAEEAIDYQLEPAGITVTRLRESPDGISVAKASCKKYLGRGFSTPSGKVEFYSERLANAGCDAVPFASNYVKDPISFSDQSDLYPMLGISGERTNRFTHSQFHTVASLLNNEQGCVIDIHATDADVYRISEGDTVCVETPRGAIQMKARISDIVRPGLIRIAWGWGDYNPVGNLNNLTDDDRRGEMTGTPSARSFMCRISRVPG